MTNIGFEHDISSSEENKPDRHIFLIIKLKIKFNNVQNNYSNF